MNSIWLHPELSDEIMKDEEIFNRTPSIILDIVAQKLDITKLVENMGKVLTNSEATNRLKGMRFFTKILKEMPKNYLTEIQVNFISKFYIDRLKDHHSIIPAVLDGYLAIIEMVNYKMENCGEFLVALFREVSCQSQVRQDRYNIYLIIKTLMEKNLDYMKNLGPDFVYGVISAIEGERDPRNLMFLFNFLPHFISNIPLGHLNDEMFDVVSCYYPIDFYPSSDDPAAVTRQDLAKALAPCLCATPSFGEQCLILLIEKLDSSLRLAKIDSLHLLRETCATFKPESYAPFLKTLWASIHRELTNKSDEELRMAAHEALSSLVKNISVTVNTDQAFENFVKGIIISMQTAIAEATTLAQFTQATRVLLTTANASKESCIIVTNSMIPATIAYYSFNNTPKLQHAAIELLGDIYDIAKYWKVTQELASQLDEIPQLCLTAVSQTSKEFQIAGLKTLIRVLPVLKSDLIVPFVEVLIHNVKHAQDNDLLSVSVEAVHAIAMKYPEEIMSLVLKGKCDLEHLTEDKEGLDKRLNLLCNLASIDEFTKIIVEEMLTIITKNKDDADKVVKALSASISNTSLYSQEKVTQIESDYGLVDSVIIWLLKEIADTTAPESLAHGYSLVATTISNLPEAKQIAILDKHTQNILERCKEDEVYFLMLESLYNSLHQSVHNSSFHEVMMLALNLSLRSEQEIIRSTACILIAHFLNKAEYGAKFEVLYETLKTYLSSCNKENIDSMCVRLISLYGWITKALILRGSDMFLFWLQKIMVALLNPECCSEGAKAIKLILSYSPDCLTDKQHCRISLLYRQRMFQTFAQLTEKLSNLDKRVKEAYLLSWAYILEKAPKSVLNSEAFKIAPLLIESLEHDHQDLLLVMVDILCHIIQSNQVVIAGSLQTILPRLVKLSTYVKSMDVRIKSLQCLYEIANVYSTALLLPHKQDMLLDLAPSLDDKKRLVRNMAVRARTRWYLIGAPGEAKEN